MAAMETAPAIAIPRTITIDEIAAPPADASHWKSRARVVMIFFSIACVASALVPLARRQMHVNLTAPLPAHGDLAMPAASSPSP
jgi:hypothetical protein